MSFTETVRSLRHRNFRLYFFGQWVSMTGTWMQTTAQMWLVYRLTHSSSLLGLVGFAGQAPSILLGLFGGVAADRWDRRRLIVITQSAALLQALALGLLTYSGIVQVWEVFVLAVVMGIINVFDMPARQSFVIDMVDDRQDLGNAIAMNSFLVNASRMVGPAVAGILVGFYGEAACFLLNAVSFVAVIASLLMMKLPRRSAPGEETFSQAISDIKAGLHYASGHSEIRALLLLLAVMSISGVPFMTLMPVFADQILHGGPRTVGWLMGASGIGALSGAIFLARRRGSAGLPRVAGLASAGFGLSLILFSSSRSQPLSLAFMVLTGACMMTAFTGCNTLLQSLTSDSMRGRVMGLFTMTFMGVAPIGNLAAGLAAQRFGAPLTVGVGGLLCAAASLLFVRRRKDSVDMAGAAAEKDGYAVVPG
jgi:MFS family permease